jgi:hypothetical protein
VEGCRGGPETVQRLIQRLGHCIDTRQRQTQREREKEMRGNEGTHADRDTEKETEMRGKERHTRTHRQSTYEGQKRQSNQCLSK